MTLNALYSLNSLFVVAQEGAVKAMQYPTVATVVHYEYWTASIHSIASLDLTNNTIVLGNPIDPNWAGGASGERGRKGRREGGRKERREGGRTERMEGGRKEEQAFVLLLIFARCRSLT